MGKKKFIDKKNSATFQLFARDSSDPIYDDTPGNDRVFVRVDNNQYSLDSFDENGQQNYHEEDPSSIFADAPDDADGDGEERDRGNLVNLEGAIHGAAASSGLQEDVRREILELGFPDDGYNYLSHLREIKNTGGGSTFFHNTKAVLDQLSGDVKAYDASRVRIPELKNEDKNDKSIYSVAAKTVGVRVQKVMDPEVVALLDDSDLSRFGSDVEDLEEDFVVCANLPDEGEDLDEDKRLRLVGEQSSMVVNDVSNQCFSSARHQNNCVGEEQRVRPGLDEQFDLLECQEYGTDNEDDEYGGYIDDEEEESLAAKLKNSLNGYKLDSSELDGKYKAPADLLHCDGASKDKELIDSATDVILRCREYDKNYENNDKDEEVSIEEESSSESEQWDCETIVTTYSNLDNHPAKLEVPETAIKKKVIALKGKAGLPAEYLHCSETAEKMKSVPNLNTEQQKRKKHGLESKEEKKERKTAVKKEKSAARERKKEMKYLHSLEAQRAQRTVAVAGPSSFHLMLILTILGIEPVTIALLISKKYRLS